MWVLIDNYDSFSYILYDYLLRLNSSVVVYKSDEISLDELIALAPSRLILSPGPKSPKDAIFANLVVSHFLGKIPVLGVCLGHQILGLILGMDVIKAPLPMHGKMVVCDTVAKHELLTDIPANPLVMRYHSLIVSKWEKHSGITPLLVSHSDKLLMMFVHEDFKVLGIQFHPESVGTECGLRYLVNWDNWLSCYGL